jgi:hypothetical protein
LYKYFTFDPDPPKSKYQPLAMEVKKKEWREEKGTGWKEGYCCCLGLVRVDKGCGDVKMRPLSGLRIFPKT